ncbi:MAG TPA: hypothetical protein VKH43_12280 [Thermoanaerobaculia bacterium]|nr:hypothetical protein [Thermoanaerobaculia bacterium]
MIGSMTPTALMGVQMTLSIVLSALVAIWYVSPALNRLPVHSALVPLFLVHALRYLPSSAFAPGQIGPTVPREAMDVIASGDLASAILALAAAVLLYYRVSGSIAAAWAVNIVTSLDWLYAGAVAASNRLATYPMGGNWYIMNYYAPMIGVVHVMIFARLIRERRAPAGMPISRTSP